MIRRALATLLVTAPAPVALLAGPATAAEAPVTSTAPAEPAAPGAAQPPAPEPAPAGSAPAPTGSAPAPAQPPATSVPTPSPAPGTATTPAAPGPALGDATPEGTRRPRPQRTTGADRRPKAPKRDERPASAPTAGGSAAPSPERAASDGAAEAPPGALSPLGPTAPGVPNFFIDSFRIPPFLLPIYQAAGVQYGIRWEILAAINEIETDYGRNLAVSSAGALGWMQFMPATWRAYGVDANLDGERDPFNPVDAIFAAARYLRAAGADEDLERAIFAYNHADWYVRDVVRRAKLIAALPSDLVSSLTGLTQGIFPVGVPGGANEGAGGRLERQLEDGRQLRIRARSGAAATAVTDGTIVAMGRSERLGRYVRLRDAYGNVYTYAGLRSFATQVPVPKPRSTTKEQIRVELDLPARDPSPRLAASTTDAASEPAPLATATPARQDAASSPRPAGAPADSQAAATTVVVAPPPRVAVRPPLPPGASQEALEPAPGPSASREPVAVPGTAAPVVANPVPEPQIDSPAATPPQPLTTPAAEAPVTETTPEGAAPPSTAETTAAAPTQPSPAPTPPGTVTAPAAPPTATTVPATPAAPPTATAVPATPAAPTPATTVPATPAATTPGPAPATTAEPPADPDPAEGESQAREEADPVLDPLLPQRQLELPDAPATAPSAPATPSPSPSPPTSDEQGDPPVTGTRLAQSFTVDYGLAPRDVEYVPLRKGRRVIAGTVLGAVGRASGDGHAAGRLGFEIRPAGERAPRIDPRPIVRGWQLLESTALYRARAADITTETAVTTGQILLMDKHTLQQRVLRDERVDVYSCGRRDIESGVIDRRVLATLAFLAASGLEPTVTSLRCGHGVYTSSGNVSHHTTGTAVDIAAVNGVPVVGNQGKGSITDRAVRKLLTLQGTMKPAQIITLMKYEGTDNTLAMSDHHDHIHIGWRPGAAPTGERARELESLLKPEQWAKLVRRLNTIENPKIPSAPSKYALKADRRADRLRRSGAGGSD